MDVILGGKLDALRHDLPELPELDNLFAPEVGRAFFVGPVAGFIAHRHVHVRFTDGIRSEPCPGLCHAVEKRLHVRSLKLTLWLVGVIIFSSSLRFAVQTSAQQSTILWIFGARPSE